ncbi:DUF5954 family protein [Streptomyces gamaensis]|uniref:DUF5954 family protein n=1 Tax=Streptomyces gamaensis TaxID=1763542 RepID=A0ABW0YVF4_9ACTN
MSDPSERVPGYRQIRMTVPAGPEAVRADEEAWAARESHPVILGAGGPVFGVAREREEGGWELCGYYGERAPQDARDTMAVHFRRKACEIESAGGPAAAARECLKAAERLDWEVIDELTVLGSRYRVVRAERFIRTGPDGPEPPRPSDPDPAEPGASHELPRSTEGFVLDTVNPTGMSEGILKAELLSLVLEPGTVPRAVRDESVRAARTHPGGVLLPVTFVIAERVDGDWQPLTSGSDTPQGARDALTMDLRVMAPVLRRLDEREREEYARAADRFDTERGAELYVADRHFRVVRVESLIRFGPDGPEGPRPSDPDPQPPVMVHDRQLREQGVITGEEDEDEHEPPEEVKEMMVLVDKERERRKRLEESRRRGSA